MRAGLALAAMLVLTAFGVATSTPRSAAGAGGRATDACEDGVLTLHSGDRERQALVRLPPGRGPHPLVVALHGAGGTGPFMERYSGLTRIARREGFVVAYPSAASDDRYWAISALGGEGDVDFVRDLIDALVAAGCADPDRVSLAGVSNGGGLAARAGCELSDRLAAIVSVAGGYASLPPCRPDRPVSVLEIHGTADGVVPYWGKPETGRKGSVPRWLRGWARRDGCELEPERRRLAPRVVRARWSGCRSGTRIQHFALAGAPHDWPGATPRVRRSVPGVSASELTWRFVRTARRSAPDVAAPAAPAPAR
jgi:polyhydroxybutyrate depolymerase